jgi:lycopene cyclase domain-containing protein
MSGILHYTYLIVDLASISIPFIAGFHRRIHFYKNTNAIIFPLLLSLIPFIPADILFTSKGIWGFNPKYVLGIYLFNLPLEEYLFFICIPFSCLFTFHCFRVFNLQFFSVKTGKFIAYALAIILLIFGLLFYNKWYTASTFIACSIAIFIALKWFSSFNFPRFFSAYLILLIPFIITNGILTGTGLKEPIVWYNNNENIGIRLLTIPFEDIFYGLLLILLSCVLNEWWMNKKILNTALTNKPT